MPESNPIYQLLWPVLETPYDSRYVLEKSFKCILQLLLSKLFFASRASH